MIRYQIPRLLYALCISIPFSDQHCYLLMTWVWNYTVVIFFICKQVFHTFSTNILFYHHKTLCQTKINLRERAVFHKTVRVCHVYCNFKIGFTCRITVIFGTLKDGSLLINTLASNICFSCRNMFQNGVDALSKIVDAFLSKSSKFYLVRIIR